MTRLNSTTTLQNSIYAGNSAINVGGVGSNISLGNNLSDDATGGGGPADLVTTEPVLAPLGNYGGSTQTHALLPGSPAINAGNNAGAPVIDQRGIARPQVGTVDIGAFESRGFFVQIDDLAGDGQRVAPGQMFPIPLTVSVVPFGAGEPVSGGSVTFTSIGAGAGATFLPNPASIDADGVASSFATANSIVGSYSVLASIDGGTGPSALFILTNAAAELSIGDAMITEGDAATSDAVFTVTRTNNLTAFSVTYSMTAGTAQEGSDYVATSGTLSFDAGSSLTQTITVPVIGDLIVEGTETATLELGAVNDIAGHTTITDGSGLLTITDNDSAVVSFDPVSVSQSEEITPMVFSVALSNPVQSGVTLDLNSAFGTATAADFTPIVGGTVSFPANSNASQTVSVAIINDALNEDDESFTLTLSGLMAVGTVSLGADVATGIIENDDPLPALTISNPSQPEGNSGDTSMDFIATLSQVSGRDVSFVSVTADGTATVSDNDYVQRGPELITIPAGEINVSIPVQIIGDTLFEGDESFTVNLTQVINATPTSLSGTGTIEDDDQQPTTTIIVSNLSDPSVVGQPYTVDVRVSAQSLSPLGMVMVSDGTDSCGPISLSPDAIPDSIGSCKLTSNSDGAKLVTASYTPATGAFGESSGTASHQVDPASTAISVIDPPRTRINTPTVFGFALTVSAPGGGTPTGTVSLTSGSSSCQVNVPAAISGCELSFDQLGSRPVSAIFTSTDGNHLDANSATAGDLQTVVFAQSDLAVTKTDTVDSYAEGDLLVYTITLRNLGADRAENLRLLDTVPAGLVDVLWTCDSSGGAVCPASSGSGDLDAQIPNYPVGALLNYSFYGNVAGSPEQILNTVTLELPDDGTIEDGNLANNSASDLNLRNLLFADGFEAITVTAASGSYRLPSAALLPVLDDTARVVFVLDDALGEAARIYARVFDGQLQYALAQRASSGVLRLGPWISYGAEPLLSWSASEGARGWVEAVELR